MNALSWLAAMYGNPSFSLMILLAKITLLLSAGWLLHAILWRSNPLWRVLVWRSTTVGAMALLALALLPALVSWEILSPRSIETASAGHADAQLIDLSAHEPEVDAAGSEPAVVSSTPSSIEPSIAKHRTAVSPVPTRPDRIGATIEVTEYAGDLAASDRPSAADAQLASAWPSRLSMSTMVPALILYWLLGFLLLGGRTALALFRIREIRRRAQPVAPWIAAETCKVADRLGCRIRFVLCQTNEVSTPCLAGFASPAILLPARHCDPQYRDELRAILAHEIGHLQGGDLWWNAMLQVMSLALWFHPLVWGVRAAHARNCDAVADRVAANFVGDAAWYGRVLARLALKVSRSATMPALAMARTSNVRHRIESLRRDNFPARLPRRRIATTLALAAMGIVFVGGLHLAPSQANEFLYAEETQPENASQPEEKPASKPGNLRPLGGRDDFVGEPADDTKDLMTIQAVADDTGEPLRDIAIHCHGRIGGNVITQHINTNEDGLATFEWERGAVVQNLWMTAKKEHFVPVHYVWRSELRAIELPRQLEMRFQPGKVFEGVVRDKLGQPVPGAKVALSMPITWPRLANYSFEAAELTTDKDGRWRWTSAPAEPPGFSVKHPDYLDGMGGRPTATGEWVTVLRQGIHVKGRAMDRDGKPIPYAAARLGFDHFGSSAPKTRADEDGHFVLKNCKPGKSLVTVQADGFSPQFQDVVVAEGVKPLEFKLEPGHTMRVRVVDEQGQPIAGVFFSSDTWRGYRSLEFRRDTDARGRVVWNSAPVDTVLCDLGKTGHLYIRRLPLKASEEEHVVTLRRELVVSGMVSNAEGQRLPSFRVRHGRLLEGGRYVYWSPDEGSLFTDGKYSMKFDEPSEAYVLRFEADGYLPTESPSFNPQDGPQTFDVVLKPGEGSSAVVLLPSGNPAEGAEVVLATRERRVSFRQGRLERNAATEIITTGGDGRFRLLPQNDDEPFVVVIVHDEGFAELTREELAKTQQIKLEPWGRIFGMVRLGNRPDPNRVVTFFSQSPSRNFHFVHHDYQTTADSVGRFSFERVIPGGGILARVVVKQVGNGSIHTPGWHTRLDVKSGEITRGTIGGTGHVVIGQLKLDRKADFPIDWTTNERVMIERKNADDADSKVPFRCAAYFDKAGRFSIPDVPPGSYEFHVSINNPRPGSSIGEARLEFEVPKPADGETDQLIDLGTITAKLFDTLDAGERAPDFVAEALAGDPVRLSDYRGKVVLLNFWGTWSAPSLAEIPTLKEVQQEHGANERFAIVGLSTDSDLATAKKYLDGAELGWRQAYIGQRGGVVAERYMVRAYPATFLIGPDQRVLAKNLSGDKLKDAVTAALADETLFKKQASADSARFPVTRYEPAGDRPLAKPAAIVLDDTDPTFEADKPHHDRLNALDASGKELWSHAGFNNAGTVGGVHGVVFDRRRERVFIREDVANRITAFDLAGKKLWQIDGIDASAIAVDEQTGNLWATGGPALNQGETIVFDPTGNQVAAHPYVGIDLTYNPHDGAIWLAGYEIIKLSREGKVLFRKRVEGWCCPSVSANTTDGSVWLVERDHSDVPRSRNRVCLLDATGEMRTTVELGKADPFAIACASKTGDAWVACRDGLRRISTDGRMREPLPIEANQVSISPSSGDLWVSTNEAVLRLDSVGQIVKRVPFSKASRQSWLVAF